MNPFWSAVGRHNFIIWQVNTVTIVLGLLSVKRLTETNQEARVLLQDVTIHIHRLDDGTKGGGQNERPRCFNKP